MIRSLRELGKTVLLTTHYLDEAEQLADRVAVLRQGEIVALGTPRELTSRVAATEIRYRRNGREVVVETHEPTKTLHELTGEALAGGVELEGLEVLKPSLEDIYLDLTGDAGMSVLLHQFRAEQRLYWRSRELAFFTFIFPLLIYVLLGSVYGDDPVEGEGVTGSAYLLAGVLGYGAAATAFAGLAILVVIRRETGILKRLSGTPLPAVGLRRGGARVDGRRVRARGDRTDPARQAHVRCPVSRATVLGGDRPAARGGPFAALGVALTTFIRSAEGASAVISAIYLPMAFLAGLVLDDERRIRPCWRRSRTSSH